jgi:hypothetical protein
MARQRYVVIVTTPDGTFTSPEAMLKGPARQAAHRACQDWRAQKTTHSVGGTHGDYILKHLGKPVGSVKLQPASLDSADDDGSGVIMSPSPEPSPSPSHEPDDDDLEADVMEVVHDKLQTAAGDGFQGYHVAVTGVVHVMAESPHDAEHKVLKALRKQRLAVFTKISVAHKTAAR